MIESIQVQDVASYGKTPETLAPLSKLNFIFGCNATGKTTITRIIADESNYPTCTITWKAGRKLQPMVYNRDFIARNFNQSTELKGIFTLGEKNVDIIKKIDTAKSELDALTTKITVLNIALNGEDGASGKTFELATLEDEFKTTCWSQKQEHDDKLSAAFKGYRNNAQLFKDKILQESKSNTAMLRTLEYLHKKALAVFGPTPKLEKIIPSLQTESITVHESNPILKKRVIGKQNVDISAMIKKLGNSDWVKEGRSYYELNDKVCPFCQQTTPDSFEKSLNDYFDETFETDTASIRQLETNYKTDTQQLQKQIDPIITEPPKFLDLESLKTEKALMDSIITTNIQRLATKKKEPSQEIELESLSIAIAAIKTLIDAASILITEHNNMVNNLEQERISLIAEVWKYILEKEIKAELAAYKTNRDILQKVIDGLKQQIKSTTQEQSAKAAEIRTLERDITSVQPTIDGINALLSSFGFRNFSLAKAEKTTCYKLVRADRTDAKETLSEGEMAFVTFLYFYHLLKGSDSESGITTDRILVIDDPVSSLDCDTMFIVSNLIKNLFTELLSRDSRIKQIFLLTHNVYFHKEVTFDPRRKPNKALKHETFWIVHKPDTISKLEKHESNPINTSYEMLWAEVRKSDRANLTIQNTLRRILEYYFKILGRMDTHDICEMFQGKEKIVCQSLFSWVHSGSHYAHEDLYSSIDDSMVEIYLKVFKEIFDKSGHIQHYNMMLMIDDEPN